MPRRLLISFSGGRTSAYMSAMLKRSADLLYDEIAFVFANTGAEHEETLRFVDRCDKHFGLGVVWVEAEVHQGRVASTHRIVTFESASRSGEPFRDVVAKYGVPNKSYPHCTRELKLNPIHSYIDSLGWCEYETAVGIRADEKRRVKRGGRYNIVYPLADWLPVTKADVNSWWEKQPFDLQIPEHMGNCVWCWKKSLKKLALVAHEDRSAFDLPHELERQYGHIGRHGRRVFFRENRDTVALLNVIDMTNPAQLAREPLRGDEDAGCSESCELYDMEVEQ